MLLRIQERVWSNCLIESEPCNNAPILGLAIGRRAAHVPMPERHVTAMKPASPLLGLQAEVQRGVLQRGIPCGGCFQQFPMAPACVCLAHDGPCCSTYLCLGMGVSSQILNRFHAQPRPRREAALLSRARRAKANAAASARWHVGSSLLWFVAFC